MPIEYASFIRDFLGQYNQALEIYQDLLQSDYNAEIQASIYGNIGNVLQLKGEFNKALDAYKTSISLREGNLESSEAYIATSYLNIASLYSEMDMFSEANEYIAQAEQLCVKYQDKYALSILYNTKASIFNSYGKFAEAENMLKMAIELRKEIVSENSIKVASLYDNLSNLLQKVDHYAEAMEYTENALNIRVKVLGENHPDVADSYILKGSIETSMGNGKNALKYYNKALSIFANFYGENHPDVATVYDKLAYYYHHIDSNLVCAKEFYHKELNILESIYGKQHSKVANAINNLAAVCGDMGDYNSAIQLYEESLNIQKIIYGDKHYKVADAYNNIASELYVLGKFADSKMYYEKALTIYINTFGSEHSTVGLIYFNLSSIYRELNDAQKELEFIKKAEGIYISVYGPNHHKLADVKDKLGSWYCDRKQYKEAENYFREALKIRELTYLDNANKDYALSYNNLGHIYSSIGDFDKAEEYLIKGLEMSKKIYGEKHDKIATLLSNIAVMYQEQKAYEKAIQYMLSALVMYEDCFAEDHPDVQSCRYAMSNLYFKAGDFEKAFPLMMSVFSHSLEKDGFNRYTKHYFDYAMFMYYRIVSNKQYAGQFDELIKSLDKNLIIEATVVKGTLAEQMGLNGDYIVVGYCDWKINGSSDYFKAAAKINDNEKKSYILYRDNEFIQVPFDGRLGVDIGPKFVDEAVKLEIMKQFKKWSKKNRLIKK